MRVARLATLLVLLVPFLPTVPADHSIYLGMPGHAFWHGPLSCEDPSTDVLAYRVASDGTHLRATPMYAAPDVGPVCTEPVGLMHRIRVATYNFRVRDPADPVREVEVWAWSHPQPATCLTIRWHDAHRTKCGPDFGGFDSVAVPLEGVLGEGEDARAYDLRDSSFSSWVFTQSVMRDLHTWRMRGYYDGASDYDHVHRVEGRSP